MSGLCGVCWGSAWHRSGVAPAADAADADVSGDPAAEPAEPAAEAEAVPAECFPGGVPSPWRVKDVGPATAEQLRLGGSAGNFSDGKMDEHGNMVMFLKVNDLQHPHMGYFWMAVFF